MNFLASIRAMFTPANDEACDVLLGPGSLSLEKEADTTLFPFCPTCHRYTGEARTIVPGQQLLAVTCPRCQRRIAK